MIVRMRFAMGCAPGSAIKLLTLCVLNTPLRRPGVCTSAPALASRGDLRVFRVAFRCLYRWTGSIRALAWIDRQQLERAG